MTRNVLVAAFTLAAWTAVPLWLLMTGQAAP